MNIELKGRRALITGSTSGMGFAIAKVLAGSGASVILNGRTQARVDAAKARMSKELPHASITGHAADVGDRDALDRLMAVVPDIDILVSNAGPTESKPFFEITDEDWSRFLNTYVMAAVRLSRHYVPRMAQRGWGRVLFNAHIVSGYMQGEMTHWGACKAALLGVSRGLAENVAGTGVTVNAYIPGPTHTEESFAPHLPPGRTFKEIEKDIFESPTAATSLLKRFIDPGEIANVVTFLVSNEASAITGASVRVDGGLLRFLL
jgi:NAD(P)-dependent dehydrogenase (short-subunit alcohol dehydrogenase family)